jgi:DNA-binding SARP family transcriptional activator/tetratricopeptide (TPR) repeat protein
MVSVGGVVIVVELRLLGPVELAVRGRVTEVGPPQRRTVLAALAVDTGRPVAVDVVIERVWGVDPPEGARRSLYAHIARLRQVCERAGGDGEASLCLVRRSGGYLLEARPDQVDIHRFRQLADQAREAGRTDRARASLLREALGLWRGEPLAGLGGQWAARVREAWRRQRVDVVVGWAHAELQVGDPGAVIGPLTDLLDEYPLVEPLTGALMRALHADGRSAEALDCYAAVRQRLAEELGTDPGPGLRDVHQAILQGRPTGPAPQTPPPAPPAATPAPLPPARRPSSVAPWPGEVPAQLPVGVRGFTGRGEELARLEAVLASAAEQPAAVVISAVSGTAGVGKTALAVHWARRVGEAFPDGQLYVNLRGFDPGGSPVSPAEAVRRFLDAFGMPPARIPAGLEAQVGLYRSLLADKRVLVMLDNARDAEQVRPLLPGAPGCLALVTSRNRLTGLAAAEGAHLLTVDLLDSAEARDLLTSRLGARRLAAESDAVEEIVARCAGLPLALAIVAARAAAQLRLPLAALAGELREAGSRLDALDSGEPATQVRTVFSWSYRTLSADAARLFRLLGLHPGPDIAAPAATSLAGEPPARARDLLAELTGAHLLTEHAPGRYAFHDLLRTYATELANAVDCDADRRAATHRMLDHYLHTAHAADQLLGPPRVRITPAPAQPKVIPEQLTDYEPALVWLTAEHPVLLATVRQAVRTGFDAHVWQLATALATFHQRRALWCDWAATHTAALAAAHRLADRTAVACAHRNLGSACSALGRHSDAHAHLQHALGIYQELGDQLGQAQANLVIGSAWSRQNRPHDAIDHVRQALELFRAAGDRAWQAQALNNLGWYQSQTGDHQQALANCRQALALVQQTGHAASEAHTWDSLGYAHHHLGQYDQAAECYRRAAEMFRELGDRYYEADILAHLGDTHHAARNPDAARDAWTRSLKLFQELDHQDADALRARLLHHLDKDPADTTLPPRD